MDESKTIYLCMGSACHRLGVYTILPRLQALMTAYDLNGKIALKGHFCLNNCSEGVVIRLGDRLYRHVLPDNVETVFIEEILPCIRAILAMGEAHAATH